MKRSITHILLNNLLIIAAACLLASCAPMPRTTTAPSLSAEAYLQMAANAQGPEKQDYLLKATNRYIQDRNPQAAQQILSQINVATLPPTYQLKSQLLQANIYVLNQKINQAQQLLANLQNNNPSLPQSEAIALHQLLAYVYQRQNLPLQSIQQRVQLENLLGNNQAAKNKNLQKIAQHLQGQSTQTLNQWLSETTDPTMQAWIQLALITKESSAQPSQFIANVQNWQQAHPNHMANALLPRSINRAMAKQTLPTRVALLLPLKGNLKGAGDAIRNGFFTAYYRAKKLNPNMPNIKVYDTSNKNITAVYQQALQGGADFVIGPLTKTNVATLAQQAQFTVPTLALNTIETQRDIRNLYQFGLSPTDEAQQAADKAWADHHQNALIIAPNSNWGQQIASSFIKEWQQLGGKVVGDLKYTTQNTLASDIQGLLDVNQSYARADALKKVLGRKFRFIPRRRKDADMIFLVAQPVMARQIRPMLKFYFAGSLPVYATSQIFQGVERPTADRDLDGIQFCDMPWVLTPQKMEPAWLDTLRAQSINIWQRSFDRYPKLYALGVDAFDMIAQLNKMTLLPQFGTNAATGTLYLTASGHIYRKLLWSQMRGGKPALLLS